MSNIKLVVGTFARISTGNCTQGYIIDGDDVQERANKQFNKYYGKTCHIYERGIKGAGLFLNNSETTLCGALYLNETFAKAALESHNAA